MLFGDNFCNFVRDFSLFINLITNNMKKTIFPALLAGMMLAACSSDNAEDEMFNGQSSMINEVEVTLHFTRFEVSHEAMTRATDVSELVTHLDIWLSDGETTTAYNQTAGTDGFGSLTLTLNINKTYTMYAVAHKAEGAATLSDGVISFPNDKVTHSFFYTDTFQPTKGMAKVCPMNRIVSAFRMETTDAVPANTKKMRFTFSGVFNRWNVSTGGVHQVDRVSTVNITSTAADGTVAITCYNIVTSEQTLHNILVEALDDDDAVLESHTFNDVPLRNGYKTTARGSFFTDAQSTFSFTAEDWLMNDTYNF